MRTPTSFNLHCWAEVLEGIMIFKANPDPITPSSILKNKGTNDNNRKNKAGNDNERDLLGVNLSTTLKVENSQSCCIYVVH